MDIKGKSAQRGKFSGFVPFLQIHQNEDKAKVCIRSSESRVRIFYPNKECRDKAVDVLESIRDEIVEKFETAKRIVESADETEKAALDDEIKKFKSTSQRFGGLSNGVLTLDKAKQIISESRQNLMNTGGVDYDKCEEALEDLMVHEIINPSIDTIDLYAPRGMYGLELPEKVMWDGYVKDSDITVEKGGDYDTGRPSFPEFQDMNIHTLRKEMDKRSRWEKMQDQDPLPVLYHGDCGKIGEEIMVDNVNPMDPRGLLMAYEENGNVMPVVSDFDCLLFGTKGVPYIRPYPARELSMLTKCIDGIEEILSGKVSSPNKGWTQCWLDIKKKEVKSKFAGAMPKFGYAVSIYIKECQ